MTFKWHMAMRGALVVAGILLLAACQRAEVQYVHSLDRDVLMHLPFPSWQTSDQGKVQQLDLSVTAPDKDKAAAVATLAEVTPLYVVRLDDTHAAMVTQTVPVDEHNQTMTCHACPGTIGAYFFEEANEGWHLTSRQDAVAVSGVEGDIGKTNISKLDDGHFALTAEWGSCWQGYCGTWLVLVGLVPDKATLLSPGIALSADNDGAYGACTALDESDETKQDAQQAESTDAAAHECFDVSSKWKFQGSNLLLTYEGRLSQLDANGKLLPTRDVAQQVIYAIAPGRLTLLTGTNPVPSF
jgi:hypothetical protein